MEQAVLDCQLLMQLKQDTFKIIASQHYMDQHNSIMQCGNAVAPTWLFGVSVSGNFFRVRECLFICSRVHSSSCYQSASTCISSIAGSVGPAAFCGMICPPPHHHFHYPMPHSSPLHLSPNPLHGLTCTEEHLPIFCRWIWTFNILWQWPGHIH